MSIEGETGKTPGAPALSPALSPSKAPIALANPEESREESQPNKVNSVLSHLPKEFTGTHKSCLLWTPYTFLSAYKHWSTLPLPAAEHTWKWVVLGDMLQENRLVLLGYILSEMLLMSWMGRTSSKKSAQIFTCSTKHGDGEFRVWELDFSWAC